MMTACIISKYTSILQGRLGRTRGLDKSKFVISQFVIHSSIGLHDNKIPGRISMVEWWTRNNQQPCLRPYLSRFNKPRLNIKELGWNVIANSCYFSFLTLLSIIMLYIFLNRCELFKPAFTCFWMKINSKS